ncbi:hypothetical protein K435DRAFT_802512 [Dendrothele bispora CBS 962.96]|uniref:Uncharacterized protein n=1 Tax=Dendrothele bispora (strain CBS 962.96) TaxID=1314807 RepID=A0A4S8LLZ3_DENBC|nr:hypothetical protein K435DRAFT_802512 [Dendrothele bispora CBS 962.96]
MIVRFIQLARLSASGLVTSNDIIRTLLDVCFLFRILPRENLLQSSKNIPGGTVPMAPTVQPTVQTSGVPILQGPNVVVGRPMTALPTANPNPGMATMPGMTTTYPQTNNLGAEPDQAEAQEVMEVIPVLVILRELDMDVDLYGGAYGAVFPVTQAVPYGTNGQVTCDSGAKWTDTIAEKRPPPSSSSTNGPGQVTCE